MPLSHWDNMQHFQAVHRRLVEERLFAFLDDVHVTTPIPDRVGPIYRVLDAELYRHAINGGETKCEIRRHPPRILRCLGEVGTTSGPGTRFWRGSDLPAANVCCTPLGRAEFVHAH